MPLGKFTNNQIQKAYQVLARLQQCLIKQGSGVNHKLVISCSNEFYSLIPHNFGNENPPLLNTSRAIEVSNIFFL